MASGWFSYATTTTGYGGAPRRRDEIYRDPTTSDLRTERQDLEISELKEQLKEKKKEKKLKLENLIAYYFARR